MPETAYLLSGGDSDWHQPPNLACTRRRAEQPPHAAGDAWSLGGQAEACPGCNLTLL
jgi:hypothetical protein